MKISVFNADDHPILRKGVSDLLRGNEDFDWVGSAGDGKEALDKIRSINPDVAILDIEMPFMTGLDVAKQLLSEGAQTEFALYTLFKDESFFQNAMEVGVKGYLLKESTENEIVDCIKSVAKGYPYVNPSLTKYLIKKGGEEEEILQELSSHEVNILKLIARQRTSAEIADMLFISPKTVANHRSNISKKLKLAGQQNGLLKWAIEHRDLLE